MYVCYVCMYVCILNYAYDITQRQQKEAERKRSEKKKMHLRMQIDRSANEQRTMSESAQSSIASRRVESYSELSHSMHVCVRVQEVDLQSDFERDKQSLSHT